MHHAGPAFGCANGSRTACAKDRPHGRPISLPHKEGRFVPPSLRRLRRTPVPNAAWFQSLEGNDLAPFRYPATSPLRKARQMWKRRAWPPGFGGVACVPAPPRCRSGKPSGPCLLAFLLSLPSVSTRPIKCLYEGAAKQLAAPRGIRKQSFKSPGALHCLDCCLHCAPQRAARDHENR